MQCGLGGAVESEAAPLWMEVKRQGDRNMMWNQEWANVSSSSQLLQNQDRERERESWYEMAETLAGLEIWKSKDKETP